MLSASEASRDSGITGSEEILHCVQNDGYLRSE
jgi:hypothetical protein